MSLRLGRYETTERLAAGGMATVYLGRAVGEGGFERLVAIKVMHEHVAEEPEFRSMFLDEARLAARIRHPNVVGVIDIQKTPENLLFLVMDFVDGPSLFQLRKKLAELGQRLPFDVTLRIFVDTLGGLHAAHDLTGPDGSPLHLVHRDVSPQNILLGKDGITRITDFGVARAEERITSTRGGQLKGKIAYMPPEQIRNEELDRRGDVYAAGVALWEALTGKRLFDAMSDAALVHIIVGGAKQSPHDVDPTIPMAISDVCMRALSLRKEDRPATAADFADSLEEAGREAGVGVATHRRVASFLAALPKSLSTRPGSMPGSSPSKPQTLSAPAPPSPLRPDTSAADRATIPEPAVVAAPRIEATTTRGLIADSAIIELPKRSKAPLVVGVAAALVLAIGLGAWGFMRGGAAAPNAAAVSPAAAPTSTPTSAPTSAPTAAATATAAPLETSTATASAAASVPAAPSAAPTPPTNAAGPNKGPTKGPKGRAGVGYDPGEL